MSNALPKRKALERFVREVESRPLVLKRLNKSVAGCG
jgi:hypothetical protein